MTKINLFKDKADRLSRSGGMALDELELLEVVLRETCSAASLDNLRRLLEAHGGLQGLTRLGSKELARGGLGRRQRASILAALEIGRRLTSECSGHRPTLSRPEQIVAFLGRRFHCSEQEIVGAVYLDAQRRLLAEREHFKGCRRTAAVEPAVFFRTALSLRARGFVMLHTHPGGDPRPSAKDRSVTSRLVDGAALLGLHVFDHIILGSQGRWCSFKMLSELESP